jgi:hypothetical protein
VGVLVHLVLSALEEVSEAKPYCRHHVCRGAPSMTAQQDTAIVPDGD